MTPSVKSPHGLPIWAFVPPLILVFLGGIQLVLVRMALHDPSFSIEDGYYAKATSWDARQAQDAQNARLGWQLDVGWSVLPRGEIEVVLATPTDASGASTLR